MPTGVAGRWLVTLLGTIASGAAVGACTGSQIDERTAVRVNVQRGAATTVEELAIPVGDAPTTRSVRSPVIASRTRRKR